MTEHAMNLNEFLKENTQGMLRLFVYGTLKRGFWNYDRFCRGVLDIREAEVRGRLYEMHSGIPVLQVPDGDVLTHGTADDWGRVYGELLTFDDPESRLPAIDRLEAFHPGGSNLYRRVLVPVCIEHDMALPIWAYVAGESLENSSFKRLEVSIWNPEPR